MRGPQPLGASCDARIPAATPRVWSLGLAIVVMLAACSPSPAAPAANAPAASSGAPSAPAAGPGASSAAPGAQPTAPPAPIKLVANYSARGSGQSGLWYALDGGYYREQGLDVELTSIAATSAVMQAMLANEVQLGGLDAGASILASAQGAETALLLAGNNRSVFSVMTQPEIRDPQQLRGKTIGVTRIGSATQTAARLALDIWGLELDRDVAVRQLGQVPAILAGMEAKQVDAGVLSLPPLAYGRRAGFYEMINLAKDGPEYPSIVINALRSWLGQNDEAMRRFTRAFVQGYHRARTDKPFALAVLQKYIELDDPEILNEMYAEFEHCCPRVPYVSEEGTARMLRDLVEEEPRLAGKQPSDFIESRYLRELEESGFIRQVMGEAR
jgi:NitT/TauT family transport system substrate-binding protein